MPKRLTVSVIVPAFGATPELAQSIRALRRSAAPDTEIFVVDDGSPLPLDGMPALEWTRVLRLPRRSGPAAARNAGARAATGDLLFFVDSDVVVAPDAVERVSRALAERPEFDAVFGSYDASPARRDFLSQYKNLFHHFIHQSAEEEAGTFWAGCGAIRRSTFLSLGGFDEERYREPSIEDIELGVRMRRAGKRILLDKALQATHLKRWGLMTLLRADVLCRAVPWTRLMLEEGDVPQDLNLRPAHRMSAALVALAIGAAVAAIALPSARLWAAALGAMALLAIVPLNAAFYRFFARTRGAAFAAAVFPMHILYYLYSGATFAAVWSLHHLGVWKRRSGGARSPLVAQSPER